ncbi:MAG: pyridoxamine 5'-phosphate oxidase family protein [Oscillospiraceae bacterium]
MRRADREITDRGDIAGILMRAQTARLGLFSENYPYIVPMSYGFELGEKLTVYFHCAKEGRKLELISKNHGAALEVDNLLEVQVYEISCKSDAGYESVMAVGNVSAVEDEEEKLHGLCKIMQHYGAENPVFEPDRVKKVEVLKFVANSFTAKRLTV